MSQSVTDQPIDLFYPDGSIKKETEIVEILRKNPNPEVRKLLSSLSVGKLVKILERFKFMLEILSKEVTLRKSRDASWASSLSLDDLLYLQAIIAQNIKKSEQKSAFLPVDGKCTQEAKPVIGAFKAPQSPKPGSFPSIARSALQLAGMVDNDSEKVNIGDVVTIEYLDGSNEIYKFTLVSEHEEHRPIEGRVCVASSLGAAVYDLKDGSKFCWREVAGEFKAVIKGLEKAHIVGGHTRSIKN